MTRLLDYSFARPSIAAMKKAGAVGVLRYLAPSPSKKALTKEEAKELRAGGLQIGVVWESGAKRAADGQVAGKLDAQKALTQATALGLPASCPIFFAVDFDADPRVILPYFQGIAEAKIGHPIGVYGSLRVVEDVLLRKLAAYAWQTAAWSGRDAAGRPRRSAQAHLYQKNTTSPVAGTDDNELLKHIPFWGAPTPPPAKPSPTPAKSAAKPAPHPTPPATKPAQPKPAAPPTAAQCGGLSPAQVRRLRAHHAWWKLIMRWLRSRR